MSDEATANHYINLLQYYISNGMQEQAIEAARYLSSMQADIDIQVTSVSAPPQPINQSVYIDQLSQPNTINQALLRTSFSPTISAQRPAFSTIQISPNIHTIMPNAPVVQPPPRLRPDQLLFKPQGNQPTSPRATLFNNINK